MKKKLKKGQCSSCWGKGFYTQMHGTHGAEDFGGDGFEIKPRIHKYPCSKCNGTGSDINVATKQATDKKKHCTKCGADLPPTHPLRKK